MTTPLKVKWLSESDKKDYPAAESYLSLLTKQKTVKRIVVNLMKAPITQFMAKDISRASCLPLLGVSNSQVESDRKKISEGKPLSPILLVRDKHNGKVTIADGYHRLCAVYSYNEDESIPCKII
jgi:hypothetical protein